MNFLRPLYGDMQDSHKSSIHFLFTTFEASKMAVTGIEFELHRKTRICIPFEVHVTQSIHW